LKGILNYFVLFLIFCFGQKVQSQSEIINTGVNYIDILFSELPIDANNPGNGLSRIKKDIELFEISNQVKILTNIGNYYLSSEINDSARIYLNKALTLSKECKDEYYTAICLVNLARIHAVFAEYDYAILKLDQALQHTLKTDFSALISTIYRVYGNIYWGMEVYDLALENYYLSLEIAEKENLHQNIASAYNNIGNIYYALKDYKNAEKYFRLAFNIAKNSEHKWVLAISSNNMGNIFTDMGQYDSSLIYFRISQLYSREMGGRLHEGITVYNMGVAYLKLDSFDLARQYLNESYLIAKETDDRIGLANCLLKLGELEVKSENLSDAKQYLDSGLTKTMELGSYSLQEQAYNIRLEYFKKINRPDSIIDNLKMLLSIKDTLTKIENLENITRLESKYKEKVASQEIALLQKEKRINRLLIFMGGAVFILILIILSRYLISSRRRNKELGRINRLIEEQQEQLKQKNSELIISQDKLEKMVYGKDKFITIMSHDLKNPVSAVRGFLELILNNYADLDDEKKIKFLREVFKSVENISLLIENILYWIKSQNKGVLSQPEFFNAFKAISENIVLYNVMANWKTIKIINETNIEHSIFSDRNIFDTIIRNLLSNSLKFTEEGG